MTDAHLTFDRVVELQADGLSEGWKDISWEQYREYVFSGDAVYRIDKPVALHVSASGGHRVIGWDGRCHYIPFKWLALIWDNAPRVGMRCNF